MDDRSDRLAALANAAAYDAGAAARYIDGSPHIRHAALRELYAALLIEVHEAALEHASTPAVLDLGAGEGSVTVPFLELGARVTAVDVSSSQLAVLRRRCERFADRLEVRCEDIASTLQRRATRYDVIVANAVLHHVPDYTGMIDAAVALLKPHGQFFSFQDPLRYDSLGRATRLFSTFSYFWWRAFQGDLVGGVKRRLRRSRGIYVDDSVHDNAEYHVTRNGVDQDAIRRLLESGGFTCREVRYFSTQSRLFQPVGTALGLHNTFAVIARRAPGMR